MDIVECECGMYFSNKYQHKKHLGQGGHTKRMELKKATEEKELNRLKRNEKITCECGSRIIKYRYNSHCKTMKHINYTKLVNNN